jgi:hypothetical protein
MLYIQFLQVVTNALWYITNQHIVINSAASRRVDVQPVPSAFDEYQGFLDIKRRKIKEQAMKSNELKGHADTLMSVLLRPLMNSSVKWRLFRDDIQSLAQCLTSYSKYLDKQLAATTDNHQQLHPVRSVSDCCTVQECTKVLNVGEQYQLLDSKVKTAAGMPLAFDEESMLLKPFENNTQRFRFFEHIHLSVAVDMLKYAPGGSHNIVVCFVEVPEDRSEPQKQTDAGRFVAAMMPQLPVFHTRRMKQNFKQQIQNIAVIKPSAVDLIYKELAWDASAASNPDIQQRLHSMFLGENSLIADLRHLNPGRPNDRFDVFFTNLETVVNDVTAEDERRHNVAHLARWMSVKDLVSQASKLCSPGTPIPSNALVRLQFTPRNPYCHTALSFTSRYNVQYKIQRRQLRISHPDDHYCAALLKYLKCLAVKLGPTCKLFFCDDKAKVPLGEPDVMLSTGVRGKLSLAPSQTTLVAADHDVHHKGSLTPSVLLDCDVPETVNASFVRGQVTVYVNDSVFEPANLFRHAAQLVKVVKQSGIVPPVLLKFSDGGTDHRNTFESVKCALICVFKELELNMLIAARCAPGQSWSNPAERVMSILNIGLQNCSLSRNSCSDEIEMKLKKCGGMDAIRNSVNIAPAIREAWTNSVEPVKQTLRCRFEKLALKDKPFATLAPQCEEEISYLKRHLTEMFPSLDMTKLVKASVSKCAEYQNWLQRHCKQCLYSFQIRKCDDEHCCKKPSVDSLSDWLPDPMLQEDKEHYKSFETVYGTETMESDRPTFIAIKSSALCKAKSGTHASKSVTSMPGLLGTQAYDKALLADSGTYTGQNARAVVECIECRKPRVIYSTSWPSRYSSQLALILSEYDYTCGAPVTIPGHVLHGKIFTRLDMTCESYIELAYYSSTNTFGKNPSLCCYCAVAETVRDDALLKLYKTVLPVCETCKQAGHKPVCMRPYGKMSNKSNKR